MLPFGPGDIICGHWSCAGNAAQSFGKFQVASQLVPTKLNEGGSYRSLEGIIQGRRLSRA